MEKLYHKMENYHVQTVWLVIGSALVAAFKG